MMAVKSFNTDPSSISCLNVIHEQLDWKMKRFSNPDGEIVTLCSMDEIGREIEDSEAIATKIVEVKQKIQAELKENPHGLDTRPPPVVMLESTASNPRLPKLTLQKFLGEFTQWSSFWDSYKSSVHENTSISTIDKCNYLNSLLEGAAVRTIEIIKLPSCSEEKPLALRYVYDKVIVNIRGLAILGISLDTMVVC